MIDLIYCAASGKKYAEIAINNGFKYGSQMPGVVYFDPYFCDQNWKNPRRKEYMEALAKYRPYMATVLDFEREDQLQEVLSWSEEAAQYVSIVIIIPKVPGTIRKIPAFINGSMVRLGYSVPTSYGGTYVGLSEFQNRPVHLLGGSPSRQMKLYPYLNVQSTDGNSIQNSATKWCKIWTEDGYIYLDEAIGYRPEIDANYMAFDISCQNVMQGWTKFLKSAKKQNQNLYFVS